MENPDYVVLIPDALTIRSGDVTLRRRVTHIGLGCGVGGCQGGGMTSSSLPVQATIRLADAADVPDLFDVRTSVRENHMTVEELAKDGITAESLPGMLEGSGRGWVAEVDDQIVAFAMVDAEEATVFALFVRPEHEGQGLGRALIETAERWLVEQGIGEIWLLTDRDLAVRANGFYRHLGWQDEGVQDDGQARFVKVLTAPVAAFSGPKQLGQARRYR